jgi:HK97 gp10 family phage protein
LGTEIVFKSNLKEVMGKIDSTALARMEQAVNEIRNQTLVTLSGSRSGRTYRVPGTRKTYQASAPGEAPAQATAELRQSISTEVEGEGKSIVGRVGSDKIQALMTEFGTRTMAPRPWLRPTFEKMTGRIQELFLRRWF